MTPAQLQLLMLVADVVKTNIPHLHEDTPTGDAARRLQNAIADAMEEVDTESGTAR